MPHQTQRNKRFYKVSNFTPVFKDTSNYETEMKGKVLDPQYSSGGIPLLRQNIAWLNTT